MLEDTIAAISTPPGEGGISIVRLSGPEAFAIADQIFRGEIRPSKSPSHRILHGHVIAPGSKEVLDEVLLMVMQAPKTYTAEDMVEINCHAGFLVTRNVLEAVLDCGARLAEPGEFTKRAFLNGRIDLTQAEAVLDVIRSRTAAGLRVGIEQLEGGLHQELEDLRHQLIHVLTKLEVAVDFSDGDVQLIKREELESAIGDILRKVNDLIQSSDSGRLIREGARLAIVGKPNVGKSSLLNALLEEDRAIVSPVPGTTRDTIEEWLDIEGIPLRIIDTAGLSTAANIVEEEGARRAAERMAQADLILFMIDGSEKYDERDEAIVQRLDGKDHVVVVNKIDLDQKIDVDNLQSMMKGPCVKISALHRIGLDELRKSILGSIINGQSLPLEGIVVTHVRHRDALIKSKTALERATKAIRDKLSEEFMAADLREALTSIGEIIGETTTEEILDRIFSEFCIGK